MTKTMDAYGSDVTKMSAAISNDSKAIVQLNQAIEHQHCGKYQQTFRIQQKLSKTSIRRPP